MKKISCMKDLSIFSTLDVVERERVGALAGRKLYNKNEFIFREGEATCTIYLIKYGRVRLFKISEGGKEITLDILKEDDIFGENTFLDDSKHTMNAQAIEDTFICSCNKEHFILLLQNPRTSLKIIQLLGKKLNDYTDQVANIAFRDVKGRISATLLRLADEYGKPSPEGVIINIELTHQDLANLVNASRVMVTNVLINLRQEGAILTKGQRISLLNKDLLVDAANAC
ncbi:transcriptional regulator, Crp/Fnr family [Desulfofarcimen acetoxidans DSM 771]|uniref:Transcriptional regulator, Crp/Fnr family n=1 Tax=Desulfofarcimen acetoxidans (strain ATCC 49208 / DSM 771 / KCTC 5769 / VKM B-1644 / 5575) TaxID=485916 RepID=C8VYA1_DESAS|nr:Crp/Fnr family transcriptional regulator [Desulfofarcimen acetoxidans]ACV62782.1 transcriptional regulator, Crp/Fnr family [Desulfofarcimen acetoxidans DSM 771]